MRSEFDFNEEELQKYLIKHNIAYESNNSDNISITFYIDFKKPFLNQLLGVAVLPICDSFENIPINNKILTSISKEFLEQKFLAYTQFGYS